MSSQLIGFIIGIITEMLKKIGITLDSSPSSGVFEGIGASMMRGLANGIDNFGDLPEAKMLATVQHTMGPAVAAPQMMGAGSMTNNISFGDTHISNGLDQAAFEARITRVIKEALR